MATELMAAIPAVWPAVAMCPVVQKEIAKISAVPISRHVTAFAMALRIGVLPTGPSSVHPRGSDAAHFSGMIAVNIEASLVIVAEFGKFGGAAPTWLDRSSDRVRAPLNSDPSSSIKFYAWLTNDADTAPPLSVWGQV